MTCSTTATTLLPIGKRIEGTGPKAGEFGTIKGYTLPKRDHASARVRPCQYRVQWDHPATGPRTHTSSHGGNITRAPGSDKPSREVK